MHAYMGFITGMKEKVGHFISFYEAMIICSCTFYDDYLEKKVGFSVGCKYLPVVCS